jgi:hypothetical protein
MFKAAIEREFGWQGGQFCGLSVTFTRLFPATPLPREL